jgi:hypothetical protein
VSRPESAKESTKRTPAGKRNLNPQKNKLWDSAATPVQAPPIDSCSIFGERVMVERALVFTLLIANLTNVACLYVYL